MEFTLKQVALFYQALALRCPGVDIRVSSNGGDVGYLKWDDRKQQHEYFSYITAPYYIDANDMHLFNAEGVHPMPGMVLPPPTTVEVIEVTKTSKRKQLQP